MVLLDPDPYHLIGSATLLSMEQLYGTGTHLELEVGVLTARNLMLVHISITRPDRNIGNGSAHVKSTRYVDFLQLKYKLNSS